jgi:uncharacterized membrane protein YdjX (TVP38/TMEM64 family)
VLVGLAVALGVIAIFAASGELLPELLERIRELGALGPLAFVGVYALGVVLWIPGSWLTLAAGAVFDLGPGILYVFVGSTIGSVLSFGLARYAARDWIEGRLSQYPRLEAIDSAAAENGFWVVFLLRLSPAFPFTPLNYVLGLSQVRFRDYLFASIGMLPATAVYVYYGKIAADVARATTGAGPERDWLDWALLLLGLIATVIATALLARSARRALDDRR